MNTVGSEVQSKQEGYLHSNMKTTLTFTSFLYLLYFNYSISMKIEPRAVYLPTSPPFSTTTINTIPITTSHTFTTHSFVLLLGHERERERRKKDKERNCNGEKESGRYLVPPRPVTQKVHL